MKYEGNAMKRFLWLLLVIESFGSEVKPKPYTNLKWANYWCVMDAALQCLAAADGLVEELEKGLNHIPQAERQKMWENTLLMILKHVRSDHPGAEQLYNWLEKEVGKEKLEDFNEWATGMPNYLSGKTAQEFLKEHPQALFHKALHTKVLEGEEVWMKEKFRSTGWKLVIKNQKSIVNTICTFTTLSGVKEKFAQTYYLYDGEKFVEQAERSYEYDISMKSFFPCFDEKGFFDYKKDSNILGYFISSRDSSGITVFKEQIKKPRVIGIFSDYFVLKIGSMDEDTLEICKNLNMSVDNRESFPYEISMPHSFKGSISSEAIIVPEFAMYEIFAISLGGQRHETALVRDKDNELDENGVEKWHYYDGMRPIEENVKKEEILTTLKVFGEFKGKRTSFLFYRIKKSPPSQQNQLATIKQLLVQLKTKLTQLLGVLAALKK